MFAASASHLPSPSADLPPQVHLEVFDELSHGFLMLGPLHRQSAEAATVCLGWIREALDAADAADAALAGL